MNPTTPPTSQRFYIYIVPPSVVYLYIYELVLCAVFLFRHKTVCKHYTPRYMHTRSKIQYLVQYCLLGFVRSRESGPSQYLRSSKCAPCPTPDTTERKANFSQPSSTTRTFIFQQVLRIVSSTSCSIHETTRPSQRHNFMITLAFKSLFVTYNLSNLL